MKKIIIFVILFLIISTPVSSFQTNFEKPKNIIIEYNEILDVLEEIIIKLKFFDLLEELNNLRILK